MATSHNQPESSCYISSIMIPMIYGFLLTSQVLLLSAAASPVRFSDDDYQRALDLTRLIRLMRLEMPEEKSMQQISPAAAEANEYPRTLDSLGGGHLLSQRQIRGLDSLSGITFGGNKRSVDNQYSHWLPHKRNFDEIDRVGFGSFVKRDEPDYSNPNLAVKRNFDEIDRVGFESFVKRSRPQLGASAVGAIPPQQQQSTNQKAAK